MIKVFALLWLLFIVGSLLAYVCKGLNCYALLLLFVICGLYVGGCVNYVFMGFVLVVG